MYTTVLAILLSILLGLGTGEYTEIAECQDFRSCVYNYTSETMFDRGNQIQASMEVDIVCESVGIYQDIPVTRYCIDIHKLHINMIDTISAEGTAPIHKAFSNAFCFLRGNENGKIAIVYHPRDEKLEIVNIKKSIVSAFQVNLKHTAIEEEIDAQSHHKSHYNYTAGENGYTIQHRVVDDSDVMEYASGTATDSVQYHMEEEVELDESNHVVSSSGAVLVHEVGDKVDPYWNNDLDGLDENAYVPSIDGKSSYTLKQIHCSYDPGRVRRTAYLSHHLKTKAATDTLLMKRDKVADDTLTMRELYKHLPSLDDTLTKITRNTDAKLLGKTMRDWRKLLKLESQYNGSLMNMSTKSIAINMLNQRFNNPDEKQSRQMLYGLLSSEGSLESQQALIQALKSPVGKDEYSAILIYISFLSSVDSSTESYLQNMILSQKHNSSSGLLLAYGTLGRFNNIEDNVVNTLANLLTDAASSMDKVVLLIHALGNSGSDKIVPIIVPFIFSPDVVVQFAAIDALRAVSRNKIVLKAFASYVEGVEYEEQVIGVVRSLLFPFKRSVYFHQSPHGAGTSEVEEHLMDVLIDSSVKFQSVELNTALRAYFKYVDTKKLKTLDKILHKVNTNATRTRRATTTDWTDENDIYHAVADHSSRIQDEQDYEYHRAFIWAEQLGTEDLHITVAAGGFGGVGTGGYKMFARGVLEIHAWGEDIVGAEIEYNNQFRSPQTKTYSKIAGVIFLDVEVDHIVDMPYIYEYSKTLIDVEVFHLEFHFFLYVGTLDVHVSANVNAQVNFEMMIDTTEASATLIIEPTFTVSGEASAKILLFWTLGFEVGATLGYSIQPVCDIGFCTYQGDASTCLALYTRPAGSIDVAAFYQDWSGKHTVDWLTSSWDLSGSSSLSLLWGKCGVCDCPGSLSSFCYTQESSGSPISSNGRAHHNDRVPAIENCHCSVVDL